MQQVGGGVQLRGLLAVVLQAALEALLGAGVAGLLVLLEALVEAVHVHGDALLGGHLAGDLHREAVGVVQLEGVGRLSGLGGSWRSAAATASGLVLSAFSAVNASFLRIMLP